MTELPESLVIIGGGVIGLEFASYFSTAGTDVTVIEMLDHLAGTMDTELSSLVRKKLEDAGVKFMLSTKVTQITENGVCWESGNSKGEVKAALALVSVGRGPTSTGWGLRISALWLSAMPSLPMKKCRRTFQAYMPRAM